MATLPSAGSLGGVLLDVDGTLYRQRSLRIAMVAALLRLPLEVGLVRARRTWRTIGAFRRVVEELRNLPPGRGIDALRYELAAEKTGVSVLEVREIVREWMLERPLPRIASSARKDVHEFLAACTRRGLRIGVLSDYPVDAKLEALGVDSLVSLRLASIDPEIDALKPHTAGFEHACRIWELPAQSVLYVGDREEVDAKGAGGVGMPCAILGGRGPAEEFVRVRGFAELLDWVRADD